jgi:hypothetical protein
VEQKLSEMSPADALAALKERWGTRWEVWYVNTVVKPDRWGARPWGAPVATVTARSPADLDAGIAQADKAARHE